MPLAHRAFLEELYAAGVAAAAPGPALERALSNVVTAGPVRLLALGKAALPMAEAAIAVLAGRGLEPAGGLIVSPTDAPSPDPALRVVPGDHPEPGGRSRVAARALAEETARTAPDDEVWVLLSGGATSLLGAPIDGVRPRDLTALYTLLLGSGLDIAAMNRIRKRFSRWGGGRLAAALAPAHVRVFIVSDVIADDLASIASGPCVPDPSRAAEVRAALDAAGLTPRVPPGLLALLDDVVTGRAAETPKPGDPVFERVETTLIVSNRLALEAIATRAARHEIAAEIAAEPLAGEAAVVGRDVAARLISYARGSDMQRPRCVIWGGETTVTLSSGASGLGGRSQELALAAARTLAGDGEAAARVSLVAAGTDGRDGPTDAAGAFVDRGTWDAIRRAGRDPAHDLSTHDAYHALDAAGALLKPGLTGTNVMDVVIGLC
jgi:hydroxypyruvate reductase